MLIKKQDVLEIAGHIQTLKYGLYMVSGLISEGCEYLKGCKKISIAKDPKPQEN